MHNTEAILRSTLADTRTKENTLQNAKAAKLTAAAAQRTADQAGKQFILTARDSLKPRLGSKRSQPWVPAGFVNNSFGIPKSLAERVALLVALKDYFTANAGHEAPSLDITATEAQAQHDALSGAITG